VTAAGQLDPGAGVGAADVCPGDVTDGTGVEVGELAGVGVWLDEGAVDRVGLGDRDGVADRDGLTDRDGVGVTGGT
jgi:hypothetical protein